MASRPAPVFQVIGRIRSRFLTVDAVPIQPTADPEGEGEIALDPDYAPGLADLSGFERIWILTWLHLAPPSSLVVTPFLDQQAHGVFATRSPCRPNPIGLACVRLLAIEGPLIRFAGCDLVDGTPVLDLKPYVPVFDAFPQARAGWLNGRSPLGRFSDDRFAALGPGP